MSEYKVGDRVVLVDPKGMPSMSGRFGTVTNVTAFDSRPYGLIVGVQEGQGKVTELAFNEDEVMLVSAVEDEMVEDDHEDFVYASAFLDNDGARHGMNVHRDGRVWLWDDAENGAISVVKLDYDDFRRFLTMAQDTHARACSATIRYSAPKAGDK